MLTDQIRSGETEKKTLGFEKRMELSVLINASRNQGGDEKSVDIWIPDSDSFWDLAWFLLLNSVRCPWMLQQILF